MSPRPSAYALAALVGLVTAGLGLVGVAAAAPTDPSPASTAPTTADAAPAPVPLVSKPVDAGDGLFGMRRGSVPTASTAGLSQVPIVNKLPYIGVPPLPADHTADDADNADAGDTGDAGTDALTSDADQ